MTPCRRLPLAFISESIRIRLHFFHSLPHPIGRISYWSVFLVRSPRSLGRMLIRRGGEDGGTPKNSCVACFRSTIELGFARVTSRLFSLRGFHFRLISFRPGRDSVDFPSIDRGRRYSRLMKFEREGKEENSEPSFAVGTKKSGNIVTQIKWNWTQFALSDSRSWHPNDISSRLSWILRFFPRQNGSRPVLSPSSLIARDVFFEEKPCSFLLSVSSNFLTPRDE